MNPTIPLVAVALCCALLPSCTNVQSRKIVGTSPPAKVHTIEGTWKMTSGSDGDDTGVLLRVTVSDVTTGQFSVAALSKEDIDKANVPANMGKLHFLKLGSFLTATHTLQEGRNDFVLVTHWSKRTIVGVEPDRDAISRLIEKRIVPEGRVLRNDDGSPKDVIFDEITPDILKRLIENGGFKFLSPKVFSRLD